MTDDASPRLTDERLAELKANYGEAFEIEVDSIVTELQSLRVERIHLTDELSANIALRDEVASLRAAERGWVDQTVHYRNLAISLGATAADMVNAYDTRLCQNWSKYADDPDGWQRDAAQADHRDYVDEIEMLTTERDALRMSGERVEELHRPLGSEPTSMLLVPKCAECSNEENGILVSHPCATIRALRGEE